MAKTGNTITVATWNIAAINNNPFEYWITHEDRAYTELMQSFQNMIDSPGQEDVVMSSVFTPAMLEALQSRMEDAKIPGVREAVNMWESEYSTRKIISGFLKDKLIGSKRLISMGDRVTNTIIVTDSKDPVCRPSVINCYEGDMGNMATWWAAWQEFMFDTDLILQKGSEATRVYSLLLPIKSSKYPAVTAEEEKISLALQTIALAAFDAVLLQLMNLAQPAQVWQNIKRQLCAALVKNKAKRTVEVLEGAYAQTDIILLQEAAIAFCATLQASAVLGQRFLVLSPQKPDRRRNQNSVLLLSRARFGPQAGVELQEVTDDVLALFPPGTKVPIATGDLFALAADCKTGDRLLIASFHGDTNGLASVPVLDALHAFASSSGRKLVLGMDANTYEQESPKNQGFEAFIKAFTAHGLASCWGAAPSAAACRTTFNARTYIQPQLNKAVKMSERHIKGDRNPKDFILFYNSHFRASNTTRDNTGANPPVYEEDMVFPTLSFPSDHGVVATTLVAPDPSPAL